MATNYAGLPFGPAPKLDDRHAWGIWDKRRKGWLLRPRFAGEAIGDIAEAMREAYAAGFGDAMIEKARGARAPVAPAGKRPPPSIRDTDERNAPA